MWCVFALNEECDCCVHCRACPTMCFMYFSNYNASSRTVSDLSRLLNCGCCIPCRACPTMCIMHLYNCNAWFTCSECSIALVDYGCCVLCRACNTTIMLCIYQKAGALSTLVCLPNYDAPSRLSKTRAPYTLSNCGDNLSNE